MVATARLETFCRCGARKVASKIKRAVVAMLSSSATIPERVDVKFRVIARFRAKPEVMMPDVET